MKVKPINERIYTFNDTHNQVNVEFGQTSPWVQKLQKSKAKLANLIPGSAGNAGNPTGSAIYPAVDYLAKSGITDTLIRVNQYAPVDEFRRLRENQRIAGPVKYTLGTISVLKETLLPSPLLGRDSFNPYTNTINISSNSAAKAVDSAAQANLIYSRPFPTISLLSERIPAGELPFVGQSQTEALNYFAMYGDSNQVRTAKQTLIPEVTSDLGGEVGELVPGSGPLFSIAGKLVGKVIAKKVR